MSGEDHIKDFWQALHNGVEVTVASEAPDPLLGVRDGFRRYFQQAVTGVVPIAVVPHSFEEAASGLPVDDQATLELALSKATRLQKDLGDAYHFYVATEGGVDAIDLAGRQLHFIRNWTVVLGAFGEAWGSSSSLQLPERLLASLDGEDVPGAAAAHAIPGKRRRGGIISSLTNGQENRRTTVAQSTFNALSSLFYGVIESRPPGSR